MTGKTELVSLDARRKLKIVRILGRMNVGGPARQAGYLHARLSEFCDCTLLFGGLEKGEADMTYLLGSNNHAVKIKEMKRSLNPWYDLVAFVRIFRILLRERPDIVHTHCSKAGALGRVAALIAGVPVRVHTYHGNVFREHFGTALSRTFVQLERWLGKSTTRAIAISNTQARELAEAYRVVPREKLAVIRNGYDVATVVSEEERAQTRRLYGADDSHLLVVWAGRFVPIKNIPLLASIIRAAVPYPKLRFLVVGDGTERPKLEAAIRGCPNVALAGWVRDMSSIWAAADVGMLTSRNEGTPAALIESMAAGNPFVATDVGGIRDLALPPLQNGFYPGVLQARNGFLAQSGAEAFLLCLNRLADDRDLVSAMGAVALECARRDYSAERLLRDIRSLYSELAESAGLIQRHPCLASQTVGRRKVEAQRPV